MGGGYRILRQDLFRTPGVGPERPGSSGRRVTLRLLLQRPGADVKNLSLLATDAAALKASACLPW